MPRLDYVILLLANQTLPAHFSNLQRLFVMKEQVEQAEDAGIGYPVMPPLCAERDLSGATARSQAAAGFAPMSSQRERTIHSQML